MGAGNTGETLSCDRLASNQGGVAIPPGASFTLGELNLLILTQNNSVKGVLFLSANHSSIMKKYFHITVKNILNRADKKL